MSLLFVLADRGYCRQFEHPYRCARGLICYSCCRLYPCHNFCLHVSREL